MQFPALRDHLPRHVFRWVAAGLLILLGLVAFRLDAVHQESGEWRLRPSATAPKVQFLGRDYRLSAGPADSLQLLQQVGTTAGGREVYAASGGAGVLTTITVMTGDSGAVYSLMGGP